VARQKLFLNLGTRGHCPRQKIDPSQEPHARRVQSSWVGSRGMVIGAWEACRNAALRTHQPDLAPPEDLSESPISTELQLSRSNQMFSQKQTSTLTHIYKASNFPRSNQRFPQQANTYIYIRTHAQYRVGAANMNPAWIARMTCKSQFLMA